jgi:hypothetical protein
MRAEVQHPTAPLEASVLFLKRTIDIVTHSRLSLISSVIFGLIAWAILSSLFTPPAYGPAPDLVKAASLVHAFEPLVVYTEHGIQEVAMLQDAGVAVWDLGESVRQTNMTSAPIIVEELDNLSGSLKTLAIEMTRFFANVNGDVDRYMFSLFDSFFHQKLTFS